LQLHGIENLNDDKINCCLKYKIIKHEQYTDVFVSFTSEDYYEFYDKFENSINKKILVNPQYNNEDLFVKFGINFEAGNENPYEFYNIKVEELIKRKFVIIDEMIQDYKTLNNTVLRISSNEYDQKNLIYFLKNISDCEETFERNLKNIISLTDEKVFIIDRVFEQRFDKDVITEITESFKFLTNKKKFFTDLKSCLEKYLSKINNADEADKTNFEKGGASNIESNINNSKEKENSEKRINKEEF
jgi:hypothetical protein